jgi:heptosyltransferase-2
MQSILIIQTAFIGDVILATPLIEKLGRHFPNARIDFLLRKGNESLLQGHPRLSKLWIWDKQKSKYRRLFALAREIRQRRYDLVVNCQRFVSSGLLTAFSKGRDRCGFDKNPLSAFFSHRVPHIMDGRHEVERNLSLVQHLTDDKFQGPKLYPSKEDLDSVPKGDYVCMAPTSVWFTKQMPLKKWVELCDRLPHSTSIYLLGSQGDYTDCQVIIKNSSHPGIHNHAGQLSLLRSAAWIASARMNYVNDSAPLHLASSMDAPCTAFFCSTVPRFGFYPLSGNSQVLESPWQPACRPCGLHGKRACPQGHFQCGDTDLAEALKAYRPKES